MTDFAKNLNILAMSSYEKLKQLKRNQYLRTPDSHISLGQILGAVAKKYLDSYDNEKKYDILSNAVTQVFFEKGEKNFRTYDSMYQMELYIHSLLRNALINESKKETLRFNREGSGVNEFEGEGQEQAMSRMVGGLGRCKCYREDTDENQEKIDYCMEQIDKMLEKGCSENAIKQLEAKIKKLKEKQEQARKVYHAPEFLDTDIQFTDEDNIMFDNLLAGLLKALKTKEEQISLLSIAGGLSLYEVSEFLDIPVKELFERIKNSVITYAWEQDLNMDDNLLDFIRNSRGVKPKAHEYDFRQVSRGVARSIKEFAPDIDTKRNLMVYLFGSFNEL